MVRNFTKHIVIDDLSAVPKYLQISESVMTAVRSGSIGRGATIPSINDLSYELCVARGTIEKSYQHLKDLGVISSFPGKGYYITGASVERSKSICLLFNNISAHKRIVFDSFIETLGNSASVDFFVYNNDFNQFKRLLDNNGKKYSHYVVLPHFLEDEEAASQVIDKIPKEKLILLDKKIGGIGGEFGAVYENFERDIFDVFSKAKAQLSRYHTIKLVFPINSYYPKEIIKGFTNFCRQNCFKYDVIHSITKQSLSPGEVYVNLLDDDLVMLIGKIKDADLKVGEDIGLISYNESPIKQILLNGITTISTDFKMLGSLAAQLVMENSTQQIAVPFGINIRPSI
ncbi:MAG: GntR family transcriptional regulator [Mucilaginibacter sp.]|nr:GntR family transcriptional regulator [Mucilaginibacter sp.]